jgi:hypothetical protein
MPAMLYRLVMQTRESQVTSITLWQPFAGRVGRTFAHRETAGLQVAGSISIGSSELAGRESHAMLREAHISASSPSHCMRAVEDQAL